MENSVQSAAIFRRYEFNFSIQSSGVRPDPEKPDENAPSRNLQAPTDKVRMPDEAARAGSGRGRRAKGRRSGHAHDHKQVNRRRHPESRNSRAERAGAIRQPTQTLQGIATVSKAMQVFENVLTRAESMMPTEIGRNQSTVAVSRSVEMALKVYHSVEHHQAEQQASSSDQFSNTILTSIQKKLQNAADGGADQQELGNLIDQARDGFEKGFNQAKQELEQLGFLDEKVASELATTQTKVRAGIDRLEQHFNSKAPELPVNSKTADPSYADPKTTAPDDKVANNTVSNGTVPSNTRAETKPARPAPIKPSEMEQSDPQKTRPVAQTKVQDSFPPSASISSRAIEKSIQVQEEGSIDLQITTRDGDEITIRFFNRLAQGGVQYGSPNLLADGLMFGNSMHYGMSSDSYFGFEINGELDNEELQALSDLLSQVEKLAQSFFSGDIQEAFNQVSSLGLDSGEIIAFSLEMQHTQMIDYMSRTSANPGAVHQLPDTPQGMKSPASDRINQYVSGLLDALESAKRISEEPKKMVQDSAGAVADLMHLHEGLEDHDHRDTEFKESIQQVLAKIPD